MTTEETWEWYRRISAVRTREDAAALQRRINREVPGFEDRMGLGEVLEMHTSGVEGSERNSDTV